MDRRQFLKITGLSAAACGVGMMGGCGNPGKETEVQMTYRTHPESGDKVSLLGYGCMRWPAVKNEDGTETVDQEMVNALVDHALANGVNYFDAAPMYHDGECERITGEALSRHPRESYFIATKLSNFKDASAEASMQMYRKSFEDLRTDYIDYYLLHSVKDAETLQKRFIDNGMLDFLLEERKAGRIRHLGFSFHGNQKGFDQLLALHEKYHWDFVQIQLNYSDWTHPGRRNSQAQYLYGELEKADIPVIVMEPLLGGRLANPPKNIADRLKEKDPTKSMASWAFRFAGTPPKILTVLSGMTYMEHLQDNLNTFSPLKAMTEAEMAFMDDTAALMEKYPVIKCTRCQYCMPCPYGVDIPGIFTHYNKCVNEGFIAENTRSTDYRKARRAYLVSYDRTVGKLSQADRCIGCNKCVRKCPQGISIPYEIRKIDRYIEELRRKG
ncbi:MAG: aldo/keto reductase [Bacteroidales bacterium]|nr:aldo/keto reductase [Bacteroidales bacterium]